MSLLMDALRKAEADKKQASAATPNSAAVIEEPHDNDIDLGDAFVSSAAAESKPFSRLKTRLREDKTFASSSWIVDLKKGSIYLTSDMFIFSNHR